MQEGYELKKQLPEQILEGASMAVRERAQEVDARIAEIITHAKNEFIECGLLLVEMEDSALWAHLVNPETEEPYQNIAEWADYRLGYARSSYMEAKRVVREFPTIPVESLREIPRVNFKHFRLLPESEQEKSKWIEAAKLPEKEFVEKIVKAQGNDLPDLHVEKKHKLIFSLPESQEKPILAAIDAMMNILKKDSQDASKEDALEHICQEWLENNQ